MLEPLIIVVLAVIIGTLVLAILSPWPKCIPRWILCKKTASRRHRAREKPRTL
jgi:hypothetical protein